MLYYCDADRVWKTKTFCALLEDHRHDVTAIYAHLRTTLFEIKKIELFFFSDGFTGQYTNRE